MKGRQRGYCEQRTPVVSNTRDRVVPRTRGGGQKKKENDTRNAGVWRAVCLSDPIRHLLRSLQKHPQDFFSIQRASSPVVARPHRPRLSRVCADHRSEERRKSPGESGCVPLCSRGGVARLGYGCGGLEGIGHVLRQTWLPRLGGIFQATIRWAEIVFRTKCPPPHKTRHPTFPSA